MKVDRWSASRVGRRPLFPVVVSQDSRLTPASFSHRDYRSCFDYEPPIELNDRERAIWDEYRNQLSGSYDAIRFPPWKARSVAWLVKLEASLEQVPMPTPVVLDEEGNPVLSPEFLRWKALVLSVMSTRRLLGLEQAPIAESIAARLRVSIDVRRLYSQELEARSGSSVPEMAKELLPFDLDPEAPSPVDTTPEVIMFPSVREPKG